MSYDLFIRSPRITPESFNAYFTERPLYEVSGEQAFYQNEESGVYFSFEIDEGSAEDEGSASSVAFNIAYFRPHVFALEAEPELKSFVEQFSCEIEDPQNEGMGEGPYSSEGFLQGWNAGNEFAIRSILGMNEMKEPPPCMAGVKLEQIWRWNVQKAQREEEIQEDIFLPRIILMEVDGVLGSMCVWPDAIPTMIPDVDFLLIPRKEQAPRKFLRKPKEDVCILARAEYPAFFREYEIDLDGMKVVKLPAPQSPEKVKAFVRGLPSFQGNWEGLAFDSVLNQELVEKYLKP